MEITESEKSKTIFFYELCRLCLDKIGVCDVFKTEDLSQDIFLCTGVKIKSTDNLPQKICGVCFEVVVHAKNLRALALKNDKNLRLLFDDSTKNDDVVPADDTNNDEIVKSKHFEKKSSKNKDSNPKHTISIRKDLYGESSSVTSSSLEVDLKEVKSEQSNISIRQRMKFEGDNDFNTCDICNKTFSARKKLYHHLRQHNKSIFCPFDACDGKFASKGDLKKHVRSHTGEKPFLCNLCDSSFTQKGSLRVHKETVHNLVR